MSHNSEDLTITWDTPIAAPLACQAAAKSRKSSGSLRLGHLFRPGIRLFSPAGWVNSLRRHSDSRPESTGNSFRPGYLDTLALLDRGTTKNSLPLSVGCWRSLALGDRSPSATDRGIGVGPKSVVVKRPILGCWDATQRKTRVPQLAPEPPASHFPSAPSVAR